MTEISRENAEKSIENIIRYIENADGGLREGLFKTPERVIDSFDEIILDIVQVGSTIKNVFGVNTYSYNQLVRHTLGGEARDA